MPVPTIASAAAAKIQPPVDAAMVPAPPATNSGPAAQAATQAAANPPAARRRPDFARGIAQAPEQVLAGSVDSVIVLLRVGARRYRGCTFELLEGQGRDGTSPSAMHHRPGIQRANPTRQAPRIFSATPEACACFTASSPGYGESVGDAFVTGDAGPSRRALASFPVRDRSPIHSNLSLLRHASPIILVLSAVLWRSPESPVSQDHVPHAACLTPNSGSSK